jgi:pyridoxamine 5'-phosphate oxidase family protein
MYYYAVMATTIFSRKEIEYLKSQRLARIATAAATSSSDERGSIQPDMVPVGFDYDGNYFYVVYPYRFQ